MSCVILGNTDEKFPMRYAFPVGITTDEVRAVIDAHNARTGTKAFIEADNGDHTVFNYIVAFENSFPDPDTGDAALDRAYTILRECRGLIMSKATGKPLARRFHKFHNVNERPSTQAGLIDWSRPHRILQKLDGSMITPFFTDSGELRWGTKMGQTEVAGPVVAHVSDLPQYRNMAEWARDMDVTPIYEWCSRKQRIVIDYPEDRLILTAVRDNYTGTYWSYDELMKVSANFFVPLVEALPGSVENIQHFMEQVRDLKGEEGYIIRFDDGHMVKIKAEEYCRLHKTKEVLQLEKNVWELVLSETLDDAKAFMDEADRDRVDRFAEALHRGAEATGRKLVDIVAAAKAQFGDDRKAFAMDVVAQQPPIYKGMLFQVWMGQDATDVVKDVVRKNTGTITRVNEVRDLVGGLSWDDYREKGVVMDA